MSHWDFGRPPAEHHDDSGPGEAGYPADTLGDGDWWPDAGGEWWPDGGEPAGAASPDAPDAEGAFRPGAFSWDGFGHDDGRTPPGDGFADGGAQPGTGDPFSPGYGDGDADTDDWDEELGPYPVTYERDDDVDDAADADADAEFDGGAGPGPREPWAPGGTAPGTGASVPRRPWTPGGAAPDLTAAPGSAPTGAPGTPAWAMSAHATAAAGGEEWADWDLDAPAPGRPGRGGRRSRWLIPAGIAVAAAVAGAGTVALTAHHGAGAPASQPGRAAGSAATAPARSSTVAGSPATSGSPATAGGSPPATSSPAAPSGATTGGAPLTLAQAQGVLAGYTAANNSANAQRDAARLATIETGSSLAIDTALYQAQRAAGTAPYPSFSPLKATYYLPGGEPGTGPRWFAVQVANAFQSSPGTVSSTEYLLFTQSAPGAPWQDAIEPYLVPAAAAPQVALDADGLATAVALDAATAAVAPGQLPAGTAASLDAAGTGQAGITAPGTLADLADQRFWRSKLPGGQVTDVHAPATGASGQAFALRTADGGALVFYTDTARLTITPPAGSMLHLTIPGFFTPGQARAQANVDYQEQFAAYDPPSGGGVPRIVADYAAVTGTG